MNIGGCAIIDGMVVRFCDDHGKPRPAVVIAVLDSLNQVVVVEGTGQSHWASSGVEVLLCASRGSRECLRMGLAKDKDTYFYARDTAIKILDASRVQINRTQLRTCPEDEFRRMQQWAFDRLRTTNRVVHALVVSPPTPPNAVSSET